MEEGYANTSAVLKIIFSLSYDVWNFKRKNKYIRICWCTLDGVNFIGKRRLLFPQ